MSVSDNLLKIRSALPSHVKLVAVSKTVPPEVMMEAYAAGQRSFGENKAQEMTAKQPVLPPDCEWHFIGHLQTNKVKYIAPFVHLVHSADRYELLLEINKQASKYGRTISCLLQFHIAQEDTKFGLNRPEAEQLLEKLIKNPLNHVKIVGVMGMATFTNNTQQIRREFKELRNVFERLKSGYFAAKQEFREISMGMTSDYKIAIDEGSTMVRIGSAIFGERHKY